MTFPYDIQFNNVSYKKEQISPESPYPAGYSLFRIRKWGEKIMMDEGKYSIWQRYTDISLVTGTFQVVELYVPEIDTWGAISIHHRLTNTDMLEIANAQLKVSGINTTEPLKYLKTTLKDGFTLKQKMGWIYESGWTPGTPPGLVSWGEGEFWEVGQKRFGTMVSGDNYILVSDKIFTFNCRLPNINHRHNVPMRKVISFRKDDFKKNPLEFPYLWHWASCAYKPDDRIGNTPVGRCYIPSVMNSIEFPIGGFVGQSLEYYIPDSWIYKE